MKNLSLLDGKSLLEQTQALIAEERRIELELLDYLKEIDRRLLHLEMGYASLYDFAVQFLGLSEASAYRRIAAMRIVREIPEIKTGLELGKFSLTNIAAAQTFFRAEKKRGVAMSTSEKKSVLNKIEGLSKRECERKLLEISPAAIPQEKERAITPELTELKIVVDADTIEVLNALKNALPNLTTAELIARALKDTLARVSNTRTPKFAPVQKLKSQSSTSLAETRRQTFANAKNQCEYISPSGRRCNSTYDLEIDHRTPRAMGGTNLPHNLRVLCRAHNSCEAVRVLGVKTMQPYLPNLQGG